MDHRGLLAELADVADAIGSHVGGDLGDLRIAHIVVARVVQIHFDHRLAIVQVADFRDWVAVNQFAAID